MREVPNDLYADDPDGFDDLITSLGSSVVDGMIYSELTPVVMAIRHMCSAGLQLANDGQIPQERFEGMYRVLLILDAIEKALAVKHAGDLIDLELDK